MEYKCKNRIAILMSTFNGEKYIREQIDSILKQTNNDWELFIRDDGSTDATFRIINGFQSYQIHIVNDSQVHRGVASSFFYLLSIVESEYYMFCDQDDVWLTDKINVSINEIMKFEPTKPALVCTDLRIVDKNLECINDSMWKSYRMISKLKNLDSILVSDFMTGCTMIFNNLAKIELLKIVENKYNLLHDQLLAIAVYKSNGNISAIQKQTILYRQHGNNVFGAKPVKNVIIYRLRNILKLISRDYYKYKSSKYYFNIGFFKFIILRIKSINL